MRKLPKNCPCRNCDKEDDCSEPCDKLQELIERIPLMRILPLAAMGLAFMKMLGMKTVLTQTISGVTILMKMIEY